MKFCVIFVYLCVSVCFPLFLSVCLSVVFDIFYGRQVIVAWNKMIWFDFDLIRIVNIPVQVCREWKSFRNGTLQWVIVIEHFRLWLRLAATCPKKLIHWIFPNVRESSRKSAARFAVCLRHPVISSVVINISLKKWCNVATKIKY